MRTDEMRQHYHDELVAFLGDRWCECGEGPFDAVTWDAHRMDVLGGLPLTREEDDLLIELDRPRTPSTRRADIEQALVRLAIGR